MVTLEIEIRSMANMVHEVGKKELEYDLRSKKVRSYSKVKEFVEFQAISW